MKFFILVILSLASSLSASVSSYPIENINFPDDMPPEIGGLAFDQNGNLYACLRRGDVVVTKPGNNPNLTKWKVFATGLHNPMGMLLVGPGHIIVSQMAELTEIIDTDMDGIADRYNNLSTDFGISGNYHETNAICRDGNGGLFIALGTASHNGPTFFLLVENIQRMEEGGVIFRPINCADGSFTTIKMESFLHLRADSVCITE